ncbi:MAG: hypothetical protein ACI8TX_003351, partial [Hyphomicrobiaceae bacterium]
MKNRSWWGLSLLLGLAFVVTSAPSAVLAQVQSKAQRNCIYRINARMSGVALKEGIVVEGCVSKFASGRLDEGVTLQRCRVADGNTVDGSVKGLHAAEAQNCGTPPDFGFTNASIVSGAAIGETLKLYFDIFGLDGDKAIVTELENADGAKCQQNAQDAWRLLLDRILDEFAYCKKKVLIAGADGPE